MVLNDMVFFQKIVVLAAVFALFLKSLDDEEEDVGVRYHNAVNGKDEVLIYMDFQNICKITS